MVEYLIGAGKKIEKKKDTIKSKMISKTLDLEQGGVTSKSLKLVTKIHIDDMVR